MPSPISGLHHLPVLVRSQYPKTKEAGLSILSCVPTERTHFAHVFFILPAVCGVNWEVDGGGGRGLQRKEYILHDINRKLRQTIQPLIYIYSAATNKNQTLTSQKNFLFLRRKRRCRYFCISFISFIRKILRTNR